MVAAKLSPRDYARFSSKIGRRTKRGCRLWRAGKFTTGYGIFHLAGKSLKAHRVAFYMHHGRWPRPACLHTCDQAHCVAVEHLWEGTVIENNADMRRKGRARYLRGERNGQARLTAAQVRAIRRSAESARVWAKRLGISPTTINHARYGRSWKWLNTPPHRWSRELLTEALPYVPRALRDAIQAFLARGKPGRAAA